MFILEVIPLLGTGGAEKFTIDLSNELANEGHNVILVTLFDNNDSSTLEGYVNTNLVKRVSLHKKSGFDISCFTRLLHLICQVRPDIVHAHVGAIKYLVLAATLYRKCKFFATIHSEAKREAGSGIELYSRKFLFKMGFVTPVSISEESELSFQKFYGCNCNMIHNGCAEYKASDIILTDYHRNIEYLFVHAGRLQKVKNQIMLVKTFDQLIKEGYNVRLIILGRKEDISVYEEICPYFSDRIIYLGEQRDTRAYFSMADAFCLSSSMEGMPISIIEAFSVGCIPIVTPVGGCVNIINNMVNGILAENKTMEEYYNAVKKFMDLNDETKTKMKRCAKITYKEKFSITNTARNYVQLFNE